MIITNKKYHGLRKQHKNITGTEALSIAGTTSEVEVIGVLYEGHKYEREIYRYVLNCGFNSQVLFGSLS